MNFLAVRQGWTNARIKAVAARKARNMPGRLSSIPKTTAAIASKPQIARRISVIFLLYGVEKALIMIVSFLIADFALGYLTVWLGGGRNGETRRRGSLEFRAHTFGRAQPRSSAGADVGQT